MDSHLSLNKSNALPYSGSSEIRHVHLDCYGTRLSPSESPSHSPRNQISRRLPSRLLHSTERALYLTLAFGKGKAGTCLAVHHDRLSKLVHREPLINECLCSDEEQTYTQRRAWGETGAGLGVPICCLA